jgi:hypothetical protein
VPGRAPKKSVADEAKDLLADQRNRISLDDFVNEHLRIALVALSADHFPLNVGGTNRDLVDRVGRYEAAVNDLLWLVILIGRWGDAEEGRMLLEKILLRVAETAWSGGGTVTCLQLRWYPLVVLMYGAGIAALSARRDAMLATTLLPAVGTETSRKAEPLAVAVLSPLTQLADGFKVLPGLEQKKYARSEHLFAFLRSPLDELLFLGRSYEFLFDRFEVLLALAFADLRDPKGEGDVWGPPGRFAWKHRNSDSPLDLLIEEVKAAGDGWPLLGTGLFGRQSKRLLRVAEAYRQVVNRYG